MLPSLAYAAYVASRNYLFDHGFFPQTEVSLPVVSIGNIVAGGTGKTSLAYRIAKDLDLPVGILSRGYKAEVRLDSQEVISWREGDEAFLLSQKLPLAKVIVGRDRVKSASTLKDVRYILLDDGMQHRYIQRDVEIVIMHATDPFGGGWYLPKGRLRDSPRRLNEADCIFIHGGEVDEKKIKKYSDAPLISTRYRIENGDEFRGQKVAAFCGIGTPAVFFKMLEELHCEIVVKKILPDHDPLKRVHEFVAEAKKKGAEKIICTEKDYVKIEEREAIRPLLVSLEITKGEGQYHELLTHIRRLARV